MKLIGDVKSVSVVAGSRRVVGTGLQITDDPNAPAIRLEEEEILKKKYPLDYRALIKELITRYTDFKINRRFHILRKDFMKDKNLCRTRYLDPNNLVGTRKDFYSPKILFKFDKHYTKKKK